MHNPLTFLLLLKHTYIDNEKFTSSKGTEGRVFEKRKVFKED